MSENVKIDVKGKTLTLTIDLGVDLGDSASGKTRLIAKCREALPDGATVQVNVYRKPKKGTKK